MDPITDGLAARLAALVQECQQTFGEVLRDLRILHGLTQSQLARRVYSTKNTISRLENDSQSIKDFSDLNRYAQAMELTGEEMARLIDAYFCSNSKRLFEGYEEALARWQSQQKPS